MFRLFKLFFFLPLFFINLYAASPTISGNPSDITVTEDTSSNVDLHNLIFGDDNTNSDYTVTLSVNKGTLSSASTANVTVNTLNNGSTLTLVGTYTNINTFLDTVTAIDYETSSANANGDDYAILTISADDKEIGSTPASVTINLDVTAVNDAPTITSTPTTSIAEDSAYSYKLQSSDVDGDTLNWRIKDGTSLPTWLSLKQGTNSSDYIGTSGSGGYINTKVGVVLGIVVDTTGVVYLSENENHYIRKYDPSTKLITIYAGSGAQGSSNGSLTNASFNGPTSLTIDGSNNIYVADTGNKAIRKIDYASGQVTTIAGGSSLNTFSEPRGIAIDSSGNLYIADKSKNEILKIDVSNNNSVTTIASGFNQPYSLVIDSTNSYLYVADTGNYKIKKVDLTNSNTVTDFAGSGDYDFLDGIGTSAKFRLPVSLSIDSSDNIFVADSRDHRVRKINTTTKVVTTFAGTGSTGSANGEASVSFFDTPSYVYAYDKDAVLVSDLKNYVIRKVIDEALVSGTPTNDDVGTANINLELYDGTVAVAHDFSIVVSNTNDAPTDITINSSSFNQSLGLNAVVGSFSTTDVDVGDSFTYNLVSGEGDTNNSLFNLNGNELRANNSTAMQAGTYDIRVKTTDASSSTLEKKFSITLIDDIAPKVLSVSVPDNNTYIEGNNLLFTLNADEKLFVTAQPRLLLDINGTTKYANYTSGSGSTSLVFSYSVEAGLLDLNGIAISSLDLNNGTIKDVAANNLTQTLNSISSTASIFIDSTAPSISSITPSLDETNVSLDKTLTLILNENIKKNSGNVYIKKHSDDSIFETISVTSSNVTVSNDTITIKHQNEFDLNILYYISIDSGAFEDSVGNDFAGISSKDTWKFTSINNYAPIITSNNSQDSATISVNENTSSIMTFTATDADNHKLIYSVLGDDSSSFRINSITGELTFKIPADFESKNSYKLTVKVTDNGVVPLSDTQNLTVNILNVNEAPKVTSTAVTGAKEDNLYTYNLIANDEDGNYLKWSVKTGESLPSWLSLTTEVVNVFAGDISSGTTDAQGQSARFFYPSGMALHSNGNIYVTDSFNDKIRIIDVNANVTTLDVNTDFNSPQDIAIDSLGNIYVVDTGNKLIKKIDTSMVVTTIASSYTFETPEGIAIDSADNIYISDTANSRIIKVTSAGVASVFKQREKQTDEVFYPSALKFDSNGNLIVADKYNNRILKIDSSKNMSVIAGDKDNLGSTDANGTSATFYTPISLAIDKNDNIFVADSANHKIRMIDKSLNVITLVSSDLDTPSGVLVNSAGELYISDSKNNRIKKVVQVNKLEGTPTNSDIGKNSIKLMVTDGTFEIAHDYELTVSNVNDEPTVYLDTALTTNEDTKASLTFTYSDIDEDTVTATQKTAPSNGAISITGTTITYTPNSNFSGSDSFVLTFSDNAGFTADKMVNVTVNAVDDAPTITTTLNNQIQNEDGNGLIIDLSEVTTVDIDNTATPIYSVTSSNTSVAKASIVNNNIIVVPVKNAHGETTITLTALVNGLSDSISFTYTLESVNDTPMIENITDITTIQNSSSLSSSLNFDIWDDGTLSSDALSISSSNSDIFTSLEVSLNSQTQGVLNYVLKANASGNSVVTITIKDESGLEYKEIFDFKIQTSSDILCVENVKNALTFDKIKSNNSSQDTINSNLNLVTSISSICDATISWSSSNDTLINSEDGVVTQKGYSDNAKLVATITKSTTSSKKEFLLTVLSSQLTNSDLVNKIYFEDFKGKNQRKDQIYSRLELMESIAGEVISWTSSDTSLINPYSGYVTRPDSSDTEVTLTATIGTASKSFTLKVIKNETTDEAELAKDKELLSLSRMLGQNLNSDNIIYNLNKPLPLQGENGTIIEWESSNEKVISTDGDVIRDTLEDKYVTLTATLINGSQRDSKEFIFTVKQSSLSQNINSTFKRIDATSSDIKLITTEDSRDINTISSFASAISTMVESVISSESVKSILELSGKLLNVYLNSDGTSKASLENIDSDNNSTISSIELKDNGATTTVDEDGNISTTLTTTAYKVDLKLNNDGSTTNSIEDTTTNKKTQVTSSIKGTDIVSDESGNTQTTSEVLMDEYLYKIKVYTKADGKTTSKIEKVNLSTNTKVEDNTLDTDFSYPQGTNVEVKQIGEKYFIETKTTLENAITVQ